MIGDMFCKNCGYVGKVKVKNQGNWRVLLLLLLLFIIPGLIYAIYMVSGIVYRCRLCGDEGVVPANSPVAQSVATKRSVKLQ